MKIATWNVARLKTKKNRDEIITMCYNVNADILVLTEYDEDIKLDYPYHAYTPTPEPLYLEGYDEPSTYKPTEHRVVIYTKYKIIRKYKTFDECTAICLELETEKGNILVYGTIMGVAALRAPYKKDIKEQMNDFCKFTNAGHNLCICGDYNCSFSGDPMWCLSKECRQRIKETFSKCKIKLCTENQAECIDHIAISTNFIGESTPRIEEWNKDKRLSDHKGISIQFD